MKNIFTAIVLLALFTNCHREVKIEAEHFVGIDINKAGSMDISETAEIVGIVPLELTDNSMIREISKIYVIDQYILVVDLWKSEIYLFNRSGGDFVRNIGRKGQGPGEYIMFNDVFYDEDSGLIYAHERIKRSMYVYDLTGELIREMPCKYWFRSFCKNRDGFWVYSCYPEENPEGYALMLLNDSLTGRIEGFLPQKSFFPALEGTRFVKGGDNEFYFIYPFSNIIYQLDNSKPKPFFHVDFGNKTLPYNKIQQMTDPDVYEELIHNSDHLAGIVNTQITNGKLYFSFTHTQRTSVRYSAVYDLSKQEVSVFSGSRKYLPEKPLGLTFESIAFTELIGINKKELVYSINPDRLSENDFSLIKENISNSLERDSNPILFLIKIK
jgi:hypothetical protein